MVCVAFSDWLLSSHNMHLRVHVFTLLDNSFLFIAE